MNNKIIINAPAKINLFLEVLNRRSDGYHNIVSVMQTVSLCDVLEIGIESAPENRIIVEVPNCPKLSGRDNIVHNAALAFMQEIEQHNTFVKVVINKNIPIAAGLGGGSSDAATTLFVLNNWFNNLLSEDELIRLGVKIGADVPFCIKTGTAVTYGIGETIKPLIDLPKCYFVIVIDGIKESTGEMYRKLDCMCKRKRKDPSIIVEAIHQQNLKNISNSLYNAFKCVNQPSQNVTNVFEKSDKLGYSLSGSGPSFFAIYESIEQAIMIKEHFDSIGIKAVIAKPYVRKYESHITKSFSFSDYKSN